MSGLLLLKHLDFAMWRFKVTPQIHPHAHGQMSSLSQAPRLLGTQRQHNHFIRLKIVTLTTVTAMFPTTARRLLAFAGVSVYGVSLYGVYSYLRLIRGVPEAHGCSHGKWDALADSYDREVGLDEVLMGMRLLRWWLISQAKARHG